MSTKDRRNTLIEQLSPRWVAVTAFTLLRAPDVCGDDEIVS